MGMHIQLLDPVHGAAARIDGSIRPAAILGLYRRDGAQNLGQEAKLIEYALHTRPDNNCCSLYGLHLIVLLQYDMFDIGKL